jgi:hypothetical protein
LEIPIFYCRINCWIIEKNYFDFFLLFWINIFFILEIVG